jgi:hypothetical protein
MMITRLGEALVRAGESMKQDNSGNLKDIVEDLANVVSRVGSEVPDQLKAPPPSGTDLGADKEWRWRYWVDLKYRWLNEVYWLMNRFQEVSTNLAVVQQSDSAGQPA